MFLCLWSLIFSNFIIDNNLTLDDDSGEIHAGDRLVATWSATGGNRNWGSDPRYPTAMFDGDIETYWHGYLLSNGTAPEPNTVTISFVFPV